MCGHSNGGKWRGRQERVERKREWEQARVKVSVPKGLEGTQRWQKVSKGVDLDVVGGDG